jgi:hypothetical protein
MCTWASLARVSSPWEACSGRTQHFAGLYMVTDRLGSVLCDGAKPPDRLTAIDHKITASTDRQLRVPNGTVAFAPRDTVQSSRFGDMSGHCATASALSTSRARSVPTQPISRDVARRRERSRLEFRYFRNRNSVRRAAEVAANCRPLGKHRARSVGGGVQTRTSG